MTAIVLTTRMKPITDALCDFVQKRFPKECSVPYALKLVSSVVGVIVGSAIDFVSPDTFISVFRAAVASAEQTMHGYEAMRVTYYSPLERAMYETIYRWSSVLLVPRKPTPTALSVMLDEGKSLSEMLKAAPAILEGYYHADDLRAKWKSEFNAGVLGAVTAAIKTDDISDIDDDW